MIRSLKKISRRYLNTMTDYSVNSSMEARGIGRHTDLFKLYISLTSMNIFIFRFILDFPVHVTFNVPPISDYEFDNVLLGFCTTYMNQ